MIKLELFLGGFELDLLQGVAAGYRHGCMCTHTYICMCMYMHNYIYRYTPVSFYIYIHIYIHIRMYVYIYIEVCTAMSAQIALAPIQANICFRAAVGGIEASFTGMLASCLPDC